MHYATGPYHTSTCKAYGYARCQLAEANFVCSARTIPRWKIQLESIPSMYSTFAAELIQPTFRQLTFSLLPYCSVGDYPEAMLEVRTGDALANANEQF